MCIGILLSRLVDDCREALQTEFKKAENNPELFKRLAFSLASDFRYHVSLFSLVQFFETLPSWPLTLPKNELLPHLLGALSENLIEKRLAHGNNLWPGLVFGSNSSINFLTPNPEEQNQFSASGTLCLNIEHILGSSKTSNLDELSPLIAQIISLNLKHEAHRSLQNIQEEMRERAFNPQNYLFGTGFYVENFGESRFSRKMILPLLPYLLNIDGFVSLEIGSDGVDNPFKPYTAVSNGNGFRDDDAEALLNIIRQNRHLVETRFNISGMTQEGAENFLEAWRNIYFENSERFSRQGLLRRLTPRPSTKTQSSMQPAPAMFAKRR